LSLFSASAWAGSAATSSPYATQAAIDVLKRGGNALDAACAASFAINVAQPYYEGIGGGGFALIHPKKGSDAYFDFREEAPKSTTPDLFAAPGLDKLTGGISVGIPGHVAGCGKLEALYGKLPWSEVLRPAIQYAKDGIQISANFESDETDEWERISPFPMTKEVFGGSLGKGLKKGETLKQPVLAATLEKLSKAGAKAFYTGPFAKAWWEEARAQGVRFEYSELQNYKVIQRAIAKFKFHSLDFETVSFPSAAALILGGTLQYIDHYRSKRVSSGPMEAHSPERYIVTLEAFNYFQAQRSQGVEFSQFLANKSALHSAFDQIDGQVLARLTKMKQASNSPTSSLPSSVPTMPSPPARSHTAHISVVDNDGMAVALTSSVNDIFGSGITLPGFGFILNDTMADFDSEPSSPNAPAPGHRPRSNMSPTLAYDAHHRLVAVAGAAGGAMIPVAVTQFFDNLLSFGMDPKSALAEPRVEWDSPRIRVEKSIAPAALQGFRDAGYDIEVVDSSWARAQTVTRVDAHSPWVPTFDARYDGLALSEK